VELPDWHGLNCTLELLVADYHCYSCFVVTHISSSLHIALLSENELYSINEYQWFMKLVKEVK
jgi:hypothetical protein